MKVATTTTTLLLLALAAAEISACQVDADDGAQCGPGTIEDAGVCVPDDDDDEEPTSGGGVTSPASTPDDDDSDGESNDGMTVGEGGNTTTPPYAACFGGSDAECRENEYCTDTFTTCGQDCSFDTDCPAPPDGTAVQRCEEFASTSYRNTCILFCGVDGFVCPEGMACRETSLCDDGSGGGGSDSSSTGGCDNPTLAICVWE